jgi:dihydrofolate reductase
MKRKIRVISMITLDGVMQAPGRPEEDRSGNFKYGGWVAPNSDDMGNQMMQNLMKPAEYLLGRKTFEIWEEYWPEHADNWPGINDGTKYILSNTRTKTEWKNTVFLKGLADIQQLKNSEGPDLQVWGSGNLIQLLLKSDLVDELTLIIHPLTLGSGKRLFDDGTIPAAFSLTESRVTPNGVLFANYKRAGSVQTGMPGLKRADSSKSAGFQRILCGFGLLRVMILDYKVFRDLFTLSESLSGPVQPQGVLKRYDKRTR